MEYIRIYTTDDGTSRLERVEAPQTGTSRGGSALSDLLPATGAFFRWGEADRFSDWHTAPRRQWILTLSGSVEITTGDGVTTPIQQGEAVLVEDTSGKGHQTRWGAGAPWLALMMPVDGPETWPATEGSETPHTVTLNRIAPDANGESHFEDVVLPLRDTGNGIVSEVLKVTGLMLRRSPVEYHVDWHPAPRVQFVVNLRGGVEIEASDGEVRRLETGSILLAADVSGKGHISRSLGHERISVFVPLVEG